MATAAEEPLLDQGVLGSLRRLVMGHGPALVVIFTISAVVRLPTLGQPFIEHQVFRQTQTAYTAVVFAEDGIDLLHSKLPVLGPPFELPFELPLFQAGAAFLINAGLPADAAVRLTALLTFLLSAWLLWLLVRRLASPRAAMITLAAYVTSPLSVLYGRAATIDYLAVAAALACVYASVRWLEDAQFRWLTFGLLAGVVAATVKLPTFVAWPLLVLGFGADRRIRLRGVRGAGLWAIVATALAAGLAWTLYVDRIKAATPFGADFTSEALIGWNFGTLGQRLDGAEWSIVLYFVVALTIGIGWLPALVAAPAGARSSGRPFTALAALGVGVVPVLMFFNLYARHEYYEIATAPAWAFLIGLGGEALLARVRDGGRALIVAAIVVSLGVTSAFWGLAYRGPEVDPYGFLDVAAELERNSSPDELVVVIGDDWLPTVLYYAQRRGLAALYRLEPADLADQADLYRAASIRSTSDASLELLTVWPWVAPVGAHTYRLGASAADLPSDAVLWTTESASTAGLRNLGTAEVRCAGPESNLELPAGPNGTLIVYTPSAGSGARAWVRSLAPVPAAGRVLIPPGSVWIACSGVQSIGLESWALGSWPPPGS